MGKEWSPENYSLNDLAADAGCSYGRIRRLAGLIANYGYSQFPRGEGQKVRVCSNPDWWLKAIQRRLVKSLFARLPASPHVFSRKGSCAIDNARAHLGSKYMLVMDIRDCYPSVTLNMVRAALLGAGFTADVVHLLSRLVTYNGRLPQGSPTSAAVLDCVLRELDYEMSALAESHGARYTRYVDDLTFSSTAPLSVSLKRSASRQLQYRGFRIKSGKTHLWGPTDTKIVTGVSVADRLHADPTYLKTLHASIEAFGTVKEARSARSIEGQIGYVRCLNVEEASECERRFKHVKGKRRSVRSRPRTSSPAHIRNG